MLRLSSQTQQSKVRAQLELLLRSAEPGERLPSEPALAKHFGVSRTTIREVRCWRMKACSTLSIFRR